MTSKLLGNLKKGLIFVLSAPAGTGKTTLVQRLTREFSCVVQSVSFTSRKPREGEVDGVDYRFLDVEAFKQKIAAGEFLEYVELFGHYYGTSRHWVEEHLNQGKHVMLVIDTQGALQLKEKIEATFIFLLPPSIEELRSRLKNRKTESKEMVETRLDRAEKEIKLSQYYDYHVVNDDLEIAYQTLSSILIAEEHKVRQ